MIGVLSNLESAPKVTLKVFRSSRGPARRLPCQAVGAIRSAICAWKACR